MMMMTANRITATVNVGDWDATSVFLTPETTVNSHSKPVQLGHSLGHIQPVQIIVK